MAEIIFDRLASNRRLCLAASVVGGWPVRSWIWQQGARGLAAPRYVCMICRDVIGHGYERAEVVDDLVSHAATEFGRLKGSDEQARRALRSAARARREGVVGSGVALLRLRADATDSDHLIAQDLLLELGLLDAPILASCGSRLRCGEWRGSSTGLRRPDEVGA